MTAASGRFVAVACCVAISPLHAQDKTVAAGKQRAAASRLEWDVREAGHPTLGNIRFAVLKTPVETQAGSAKIFSRVYLSCQKTSGKLAIELSNTTAADDPGGLRPAAMPRLVCNRLENAKLVQEDLLADWEVSNIGDALTRGFRPFPLRECVAIGIEQEVELPKGSAQKSARIEFEITPYSRELDSVFVTCGEVSAYAPGAPGSTSMAVAAPAGAPVTKTPSAPAPAPAPVPVAAAGSWQEARTISSGKTNVRSGPTLQSAVVVRLYPGAVILVQRAGDEWWRVKPSKGTAFEGYVRQDRLVTKSSP